MEPAPKKQKLNIEANNTSIPEVPATPQAQLECTATNVMDTCDVPIYKECETHKALQSEQAKQDEQSERQDAKQPEEDAKQPEEDVKPAEQALEPKATWKAVQLPEVAAELTEENLRSIGITQSSEFSVMQTVVSSIYPGGISDTVWATLEEKRKRIKDVETLDAMPSKQDAKLSEKQDAKQDAKQDDKPSEQDNHAALDMEIDEALEILKKQDPKVLQKENERVIKELSKYVKKGKEKFVFKHLAQAQRYSDNAKKRGYHIKAVTADNVWLSETLCNEYIQRYVTEPSLTEVYIQYGLHLEREEKRKRNVYGLDDDGNLRSMTKKQMCNEINATFGALDSRYAGPLALRKL